MFLLIVLDVWMVVTLGALHVAAEEDAREVAGDQIRLEIAVEQELGRRPRLGVDAVAGEQVAHERIVGLVVGYGRAQIIFPGLTRHFAVRPPLHQGDIEEPDHAAKIAGTRQQLIDQLRALVAAVIREEGARFRGGGDCTGEIQRESAQNFGIIGQ